MCEIMKKVLIVFGTRPEAIKMAPVVHSLKETMDVKVCVTGQHKEMLDQVLNVFELSKDYDLEIMTPNQDLVDITSAVMLGLRDILLTEPPDLVLVHGDTSTSTAAALCSFYHKIPVGHVEAGLRTRDLYSPFPEELNRQVTGRIANFHFAPTEISKSNLIEEGIPEETIFVTGNTVVDALLAIIPKARKEKFDKNLVKKLPFLINVNIPKIILVTGHRRENFGKGFEEICYALKEIADRNKDVKIIYPVHLNPNVQEPVNNILSSIENVYLIAPLGYIQFIKIMDLSYIILTDSGGIQEEAPSLGKPVLVMRDSTERPEAVQAGTVKLVGANKLDIIREVNKLIDDKHLYDAMARAHNPYGDGLAANKIRKIIEGLEL